MVASGGTATAGYNDGLSHLFTDASVTVALNCIDGGGSDEGDE